MKKIHQEQHRDVTAIRDVTIEAFMLLVLSELEMRGGEGLAHYRPEFVGEAGTTTESPP